MKTPKSVPEFAKRTALAGAMAIAMAFAAVPGIAADTTAAHHAMVDGQTAITAHTRFVEANGIRFA